MNADFRQAVEVDIRTVRGVNERLHSPRVPDIG